MFEEVFLDLIRLEFGAYSQPTSSKQPMTVKETGAGVGFDNSGEKNHVRYQPPEWLNFLPAYLLLWFGYNHRILGRLVATIAI